MAASSNRIANLVANSTAAVAVLLALATSCRDDEDGDGGGDDTAGEAGTGATGGTATGGKGGSSGKGGGTTGGSAGTTGGTGGKGGTSSGGSAGVGDGGQAGAGGFGGAGGEGGEGGGGPTLPDGMLGPTPYLSAADSPFTTLSFASYFHLEDWEDDALDTPGVTTPSMTLASSFGEALIDSVDGDDGVVDGVCAGGCNDLWAGGPVTFTFDETALGGLPTHVGAVWTDGPSATSVVFEAFDAADVSLGTRTSSDNADTGNTGGVAEDRFFGVVHSPGVKRVVIQSSSGAIEVDHLQYGR